MAFDTVTTSPSVINVYTDDGWLVRLTVGIEGRLTVAFGRQDGSDFTYGNFPPYREEEVALSLIPQEAAS